MRHDTSRRAFLAGVGTSVIALSGCLGDDGVPAAERVDLGEDVKVVFVGDDPPADEPENAPPFADRTLPIPRSPAELADHTADGGPGQDGIPSIDTPSFVSPDEDGFLDDDEMVLGVVGEEVKAYPEKILVQHEIVNDELDGTPVAVTFCPLTGTGMGFERGETEFGVSGKLLNNNLVMYDRELERLWLQIPAVSIPGPWSESSGGAVLREFDVRRTTWADWRREFPETQLMAAKTGFALDYDADPYEWNGYYTSRSTPHENLYGNDRYHPKEWIYGARTSEGAVAFLQEAVREHGVVHGAIDDTPHLAVYDPALDTAYVYRNPDDETFAYDDGAILDENNDVHAPDDLPLERVLSFDAYWFAWIAYYPSTSVFE